MLPATSGPAEKVRGYCVTMRMKPSMRRFLRIFDLLTLVTALSTPSWAACLPDVAAAPMKCCAKVQAACPQMDFSRLCCTTGRPINRESTVARLELDVTASTTIQSHGVVLAWMSPPMIGEFFGTTGAAGPPFRPHLINSVLLI